MYWLLKNNITLTKHIENINSVYSIILYAMVGFGLSFNIMFKKRKKHTKLSFSYMVL